MEIYTIDGVETGLFGKLRGSNSNKFNRATKIAAQYDDLSTKLDKIINSNKSKVNTEYRLAVALSILMKTGIRVGNESSAEGYYTVPRPGSEEVSKFVRTFGLTTILHKHIKINKDGTSEFDFTGKKQVRNTFTLNKELTSLIKPIAQLNMETFFGISEAELTRFVKKVAGDAFTTKDFRTLRANIFAYRHAKSFKAPKVEDFLDKDKIKEIEKDDIDKDKKKEKIEREEKKAEKELEKERKELVKKVSEHVSEKLNNTYQVIRTSYVNPLLWEHFFDYKL